MDLGKESKPTIMVAPVVVRPDMDSKAASEKVKPASVLRYKGIAPNKPSPR